jgi:hypothetical protein
LAPSVAGRPNMAYPILKQTKSDNMKWHIKEMETHLLVILGTLLSNSVWQKPGLTQQMTMSSLEWPSDDQKELMARRRVRRTVRSLVRL